MGPQRLVALENNVDAPPLRGHDLNLLGRQTWGRPVLSAQANVAAEFSGLVT